MQDKRQHGAAKQFKPYTSRPGGVWWLTLVDADGKQFRERLGEDVEALVGKGYTREEARRLGWNKTKAEEARRRRQSEVREADYRRTNGPIGEFARWWAETVLPVKGRKYATEYEYRRIATKVIAERFGHLRLEQLTYEVVSAWVAEMVAAKLGARTIRNRLRVLNFLFAEAVRRGVIGAASNPIPYVELPPAPRRRWRILTAGEIQRTVAEWKLYTDEAEDEVSRELRALCLRLWLFTLATAMRRSELFGLRWSRVHIADPEGAYLEVEETYVRNRVDTPKSQNSQRRLELGAVAAELLTQQLAATRYSGESDVVWAHPATGRLVNDKKHYVATLREVLVRAGLTRKEARLGDPDYIRPFHDLRHTSLTNEAAAGRDPLKIQAKAGHSAFSTTQLYIDLAKVGQREGLDDAEARILGGLEL